MMRMQLFIIFILALIPLAFFRLEAGVSTNNLRTYLVLGDTGSGSDHQYRVAKGIRQYCKNKACQAVFIAGDVIYDEGVDSVEDELFIDKFEKPYSVVDLPFYIVYGNHDYLGCKSCYVKYAGLSEKWNMPTGYYGRQFPGIIFIVINTEEFNSKQAIWLKETLKAHPSDKKVVIGHRPLHTYSASYYGKKWDGKEKLEETICNKADLYIAGHAHLLEDYGKIKDCKVRQLISGGGGAEIHKVIKKPKSEFYYEGFGFLSLSVSDNKLEYSFMDENGDILRGQSL